jgi:hypothetical protein
LGKELLISGLQTTCQKNLTQSREAAENSLFLGNFATLREQLKSALATCS